MTDTFELPPQWQLLHWKQQVILARQAMVLLEREPKEHMEASEARAILQEVEKKLATTARDEMAKPKAEPKIPAGEPGVPLKLLRDTWQGEDRIRADGKVTMWPLADAKRLIEGKIAERADPLPGESLAA
jgi:hypothetical protein